MGPAGLTGNGWIKRLIVRAPGPPFQLYSGPDFYRKDDGDDHSGVPKQPF